MCIRDRFSYWRGFCRDWLVGLGMKEENLRLRDHEKEELSFYSKATTEDVYKRQTPPRSTGGPRPGVGWSRGILCGTWPVPHPP